MNDNQQAALLRYSLCIVAHYPYELKVRASTAFALERLGFLKWTCDDPTIATHDWSKFVITESGKIEAERLRSELSKWLVEKLEGK